MIQVQIEKRLIKSNLPKKGFILRQNPHHIYFHYTYQGKDSGVSTYISRGSKPKTYGDSLVKQMKRQLKLDTNKQVKDLCECPMTKDEYRQILDNQNLL
ncbi:MAG: hypothetical protein L6420_09070 [Elusimicrobia bacterium]|nr:hypothetical protein [Elusimicrobiota bacterium]